MSICEYCNQEHDGSYGSGRFCSEKCARSYASGDSIKRQIKNQKISTALRGHSISEETREKMKAANKIVANSTKNERSKKLIEHYRMLRERKPFEKLNKYWQKEILLEENGRKCDVCGQNEIWNGKPLILQLHHKDGHDKNKMKENTAIVCPNCHTQTDNYCNKNMSKEEYTKISKKGWKTRKKKTESSSIG